MYKWSTFQKKLRRENGKIAPSSDSCLNAIYHIHDQFALYSMHYILCIVFSALYSLHCMVFKDTYTSQNLRFWFDINASILSVERPSLQIWITSSIEHLNMIKMTVP